MTSGAPSLIASPSPEAVDLRRSWNVQSERVGAPSTDLADRLVNPLFRPRKPDIADRPPCARRRNSFLATRGIASRIYNRPGAEAGFRRAPVLCRSRGIVHVRAARSTSRPSIPRLRPARAVKSSNCPTGRRATIEWLKGEPSHASSISDLRHGWRETSTFGAPNALERLAANRSRVTAPGNFANLRATAVRASARTAIHYRQFARAGHEWRTCVSRESAPCPVASQLSRR